MGTLIVSLVHITPEPPAWRMHSLTGSVESMPHQGHVSANDLKHKPEFSVSLADSLHTHQASAPGAATVHFAAASFPTLQSPQPLQGNNDTSAVSNPEDWRP